MEPMDVEPTLLLDDERELQHIIAVLNATPGCSGAGESKYTGPDINRMDVHVRVNNKLVRRSGSQVFDTKLKMALEIKKKVGEELGREVVEAAEEKLMSGGGDCTTAQAAEPELSADELEWLAAWVDEQAEPSEITHEQAAAALSRHREGRAGATTMARLKATQLLLAKVRAAELRFERAMRDLERARAALPSEAQPSEATPRTPAGFQLSPPSICSFARSLLLAALTQPSPAL